MTDLIYDRKTGPFAVRLSLTAQDENLCRLEGAVVNLKTGDREPLFRNAYVSYFRAHAETEAQRSALAYIEDSANESEVVLGFPEAFNVAHLVAAETEAGEEFRRFAKQRFDLPQRVRVRF